MSNSLPYFLARTNRCLFVEDNFTRECFLTLFPSCQNWLTITVVGDSHAVDKVVRYWSIVIPDDKQVFGFIDRDFSCQSNGDWKGYDQRVFVMSRHEMENYLLNFQAVVELLPNGKRHFTEERLAEELQSKMRPLTWRWACCKALTTIHRAIGMNFPKQHQASHVCNEEDAVLFILEHEWTQSIATVIDFQLAETQVKSYVNEFRSSFETDLENGDWLKTFPGKEMFKHLCQMIFANASAACQLDYAKQICTWFRNNNQIPEELQKFMQALNIR